MLSLELVEPSVWGGSPLCEGKLVVHGNGGVPLSLVEGALCPLEGSPLSAEPCVCGGSLVSTGETSVCGGSSLSVGKACCPWNWWNPMSVDRALSRGSDLFMGRDF